MPPTASHAQKGTRSNTLIARLWAVVHGGTHGCVLIGVVESRAEDVDVGDVCKVPAFVGNWVSVSVCVCVWDRRRVVHANAFIKPAECSAAPATATTTTAQNTLSMHLNYLYINSPTLTKPTAELGQQLAVGSTDNDIRAASVHKSARFYTVIYLFLYVYINNGAVIAA